MKKIFLLFLSISCSSLYADAQAEQFFRGNKFFQEGDYEKALEEYEGLKTKGPIAWYNIGVCYGHKEQPIKALVNFKRALKGADSKLLDKVFNGIDSARDYIQNHNPPKDPWMRKMYYYASFFNLFWLQFLFLLFWFCLFGAYVYRKKTSKTVRIILGCCVVWAAVSLGVSWWVKSRLYVIVTEQSQLYAGPNQEYHTVGSVEQAEQLTLLDSQDSWYKVKGPSVVGWLKEEMCEQV